MVAGHCCIRVSKMAIPLIERGHNVHLVGMKTTSFWEQYKTFTLCADVGQMLDALKIYAAHKDVDLFHCHNEPSWFVTALKEITDKPVILDVHDSYLARSTPEQATAALDKGETHVRVTTEERNNFQLADGLVFPGDDFRRVVSSEYKLQQPALTMPSYVPSRFYQYSGRDWHGGLVYEGKVNIPEENKGSSSGFEYCDYTDVHNRCVELGMDFHLYAGRVDEPFRKTYNKALIHRPLLYEELMRSIGRHDWGLVGNTKKTAEWAVAMPNKLFEYLASGVPVVSMNADSVSAFLKDTGMGISVEGPEELASRWSEHREVRKKVIKERQAWSMNNHIHKLESFYKGMVS